MTPLRAAQGVGSTQEGVGSTQEGVSVKGGKPKRATLTTLSKSKGIFGNAPEDLSLNVDC